MIFHSSVFQFVDNYQSNITIYFRKKWENEGEIYYRANIELAESSNRSKLLQLKALDDKN